AARDAIGRNREMIAGVKARLSRDVAGPNDFEVLRRAQEVASSFNLPVMIHMGQTVSPLPKLLGLLKPGDIVTHMFAPPPNSIIDDAGHILPVENVSGRKPALSTRSAMSHRKWPLRPFPTSNHMPRCRAASTSGRMWPASSIMLFGGGANMWVTMSPGLSSPRSFGSGEMVCPIWIITGRLNDDATSCARRSTS